MSCIPRSSAVWLPGTFPPFLTEPCAHFNGEVSSAAGGGWIFPKLSAARWHPDTYPLVFLTPAYFCKVSGAPEMLLKCLQRGFYLTLRAGQGVRGCTFGWARAGLPLCTSSLL